MAQYFTSSFAIHLIRYKEFFQNVPDSLKNQDIYPAHIL